MPNSQKYIRYDNFGSLTQSASWAKVNELLGYKTFLLTFGAQTTLAIVKSAKRGRYLEIPGGPLIDWDDSKNTKNVFAKLKELAIAEKCVFIRIRPDLKNTPENLSLLKSIGLKPAPMHLAAEHTVVLDLRKPEEELLSEMRRQTRYEVKRSAKLNLEVKHDNSLEIFQEFHKAQVKTAHRQNFVPPDEKTLLSEREAFGKDAVIYVASTGSSNLEIKDKTFPKNTPIAYGLVLIDGKTAAYYEAASTDLNHDLPGAYALQWQAIKDLKAHGVEFYNLWGIAPPNQPNHRYAGVTTFKTGFGGEIVDYIPAHDLVIDKIGYLKNLAIETIRKKRRHL